METKRYQLKKLTKTDFQKILCEILGYEKHELTHYDDGSKAFTEFKKLPRCQYYVYNCAIGKFTAHLFLGELMVKRVYDECVSRFTVSTTCLINNGYLVEVN